MLRQLDRTTGLRADWRPDRFFSVRLLCDYVALARLQDRTKQAGSVFWL